MKYHKQAKQAKLREYINIHSSKSPNKSISCDSKSTQMSYKQSIMRLLNYLA